VRYRTRGRHTRWHHQRLRCREQLPKAIIARRLEPRLVARMNALADRHPRYGYRRVWAWLRSEGWSLNRMRVERLWRAEGHRVLPPRSQASGRRA
jgi:hypothetical protein